MFEAQHVGHGSCGPLLESLEPRLLLDATPTVDDIFIGWGSRYEDGVLFNNDFFLEIEAEGFTSGRFQSPLETWYDLQWDEWDNWWEYTANAPMMSTLNAQFPSGVYVIEMTHDAGVFTTSIDVSSALAMPTAAPTITAPAFGQSSVSGPNVTLTWEAVAQPDFDLVIVDVFSDEHQEEDGTNFLDPSLTSYTLEGLASNRVYEVGVLFANGSFENETAQGVSYGVVRFTESVILFGTNTQPNRLDMVEHVSLIKGQEHGEAVQFEIDIDFAEALYPEQGHPLLHNVWLRAPGQDELIWLYDAGHDGHQDQFISQVWTDAQDLAMLGDGWYILGLVFDHDVEVITPFWFGEPGTQNPLAMPTQAPQLTAPADEATSPVQFAWQAPEASSFSTWLALSAYDAGTEEFGEPFLEETFDSSTTSHGVELDMGLYRAEHGVAHAYLDQTNPDGITYGVAKFLDAEPRTFTVAEQVVPKPDLVAEFGRITLQQTIVPGDRGTVQVIVRNTGEELAHGDVTVRLFADPASGGEGGELDSQTRAVLLRPGAATVFSFVLNVDTSAEPSTFRLRAVVESDIDESNTANNAALDDMTRDVVWQFGALDGRPNTVLTLMDGPGQGLRFVLGGGGYGEVVPDQDGLSIIFTDTTQRSAATVIGLGGFTWNASSISVSDGGSLRAFTAMTGSLLGDMTVDGFLTNLTLAGVQGPGTLSIGGGLDSEALAQPGAGVVLNLGAVADLSVDSRVPIRSLIASEWLDTDETTDTIQAPSLGLLNIRGDRRLGLDGDFAANLNLTDGDARQGLGTALIAGQASGTWDVQGPVGTIRVLGGTTSDWALNANSDVRVLDTGTGVLAGSVSATTFGTILARGGLSADINATGTDARGVSVTTLLTGSAEEARLTAAGGVRMINAQQWLGGSIEMGWAGTVLIREGLSARITANSHDGTRLESSIGRLVLGTVDLCGTAIQAAHGILSVVATAWDQGDLNAGWLGTLIVRGELNGDVDLNGASPIHGLALVTLSAGGVGTVDLTAPEGPIRVISVGSWAGGSIQTQALTTLVSRGTLGANIELTEHVRGMSLNTLVAGDLDNVHILAPADGGIGVVRSNGWAGGSLRAGSVNVLLTLGDVEDVTINLLREVDPQRPWLANLNALTVTGWVTNSHLESRGSIGAVTVGGLRDSSVFAGVQQIMTAPVVGLPQNPRPLPSHTEQFDTLASIRSLHVRGLAGEPYAVINSNAAAHTIRQAILRNVQTDNEGMAFGLAARELGTFLRFEPDSTYRWPNRHDAVPPQDGDAVVRILDSLPS